MLEMFQDSFDEYSSYISGTNENVEDLMDSYTETIMDGIDGGYDTWYEYGVQTVQGLFDAISDAQELIDAGSFTGTLGDALINVLQGRQSDIAASVQQTQSNTAQINQYTSNTRAIPLSQYTGDITANDKVFNGQIIVNVDMDGENIASKVSKIQKTSGKITGRR